MQSLAPIITVPRRFWDREYGGYPLPKAVNVTFEVAGQPVEDVSAHGFVSLAEDSELRLSGLWAVSHDRFPGYVVIGWSKVGEDTIRLQLQPGELPDEQHPGIDRKRQAPSDLPEPQAKVQALSARPALEWDSSRDQTGHVALMDWRPEGLDALRMTVEPHQRLVASALVPAARVAPRRGGSGGRMRGGSRATATGRGCAKLVRTTTRLYIGVGQVREWLGEVGARTELQVKVMLDNRMLFGNHQADLLYNKGAHYYWITSRTLKRTAMGKWFLGWNHTQADGLVLLLRSPSKDEIAAAIAEGFQGKDDDEETDASELQQQQQMQQQMLLALSPPSPRPGRAPHAARGASATPYGDDEAALLATQQYTPVSGMLGSGGMDDVAEGAGQYMRKTPLAGAGGLGPAGGAGSGGGGGGGDEDDAVSGLGGDRAYTSDPRIMAAIAAAELQRGMYAGTPVSAGPPRRFAAGQGQSAGPRAVRDPLLEGAQQLQGGRAAQPGLGQGQGSSAVAMQYRDAGPLARAASEGLHAAGAGAGAGAAGVAGAAGLPRSSSAQPARVTNFSEVPGGTAFANVTLAAEGLAAETPPVQQLQQQQQAPRGGGPSGVPSQLATATSIASNLSLPVPTQGTGNATASALQASGAGVPAAAPLRIPTVVSDLLPPEYLPAAVSVRHAVDNKMVNEIIACEIHRNRQGHCFLYNFPPSALEGRAIEDWLISEDGCLVLLLKQVSPPPPLAENKSVRSNPSQSQGAPLAGGPSVNPDMPPARGGAGGGATSRAQPQAETPGPGRPHRMDLDTDLSVAAAAAVAEPPVAEAAAAPPPAGKAANPSTPETPEDLMQMEEPPVDAVAYTTVLPAPEPAPVVGHLPVLEQKGDGQRERPAQLVIPWQSLEALFGAVRFPMPVLVRFQINGELEPQVYLSEVEDTRTGRLVIVGVPSEVHAGRVIVGWRRMLVLSHSVLVCSLQDQQDVLGQGKAAGGQTPLRAGRDDELRRPRGGGDHAPAAQQPGAAFPGHLQHPHQHQTPLQPPARPGDQAAHRPGAADAHGAGGARQSGPTGNAANPFSHQPQVSLSAAPAPSSASQQRPFLHQQQPAGQAAQRQHHHHHQLQQQQQHERRLSVENSASPGGPPQQPPQPLQPMMSGPLPVVGSSKLPGALSQLNNTGSSLLPAQASNLPFASSGRPEGHGSALTAGGAAGARQANPGGRGGTATGMGASTAGGAGGAGGQRMTHALDVESRGGVMLPPVASVNQGPLHQAASLLPGAGLTPAPSVGYAWPQEGGGGPGQVADRASVFSQFGSEMGGGQEPPSPKGPAEPPSQSAKRPLPQQQHHDKHHHNNHHSQHHYAQQQQQQQPSTTGRGGSGGAGPPTGSNDERLGPRSAIHTADYSSANAGSQARAAQQHPPQQQPSLLQATRQPQQPDEGDQEALRRSPPGGGSAAAAAAAAIEHGGQGAEPARLRWQPAPGPGPDGDTQRQQDVAGVEAAQPQRYAPGGSGVYRGGSGNVGVDPAGFYPQDSQHPQSQQPQHQQQQRQRVENAPSWRFDQAGQQQQQAEAHPAPRLEQVPSARGTAAGAPQDHRATSQPHASFSTSREAPRWGLAPASGAAGQGPQAVQDTAPSGPEDARTLARYDDEPTPQPHSAAAAGGRRPRPTMEDVDVDAGREDGGPPHQHGAARGAAADAADTRCMQDVARPREPAGSGAGVDVMEAAPRQQAGGSGAYEGGAGARSDGDVEMEDAAPGPHATPLMPGRPEAHSHGHANRAYPGGLLDAEAPAPRDLGAPGVGVGRGSDAGEGRGVAAAQPSTTVAAAQQTQGVPAWQRRAEAIQAAAEAAARQAQEQSGAAGGGGFAEAPSRQGRGPGLGVTAPAPGEQHAPQWFPRLDLSGATAATQEREAVGEMAGAGHDERGPQQRRSNDGEADDRAPPRRPGVLRMLSGVVREPDEREGQ